MISKRRFDIDEDDETDSEHEIFQQKLRKKLRKEKSKERKLKQKELSICMKNKVEKYTEKEYNSDIVFYLGKDIAFIVADYLLVACYQNIETFNNICYNLSLNVISNDVLIDYPCYLLFTDEVKPEWSADIALDSDKRNMILNKPLLLDCNYFKLCIDHGSSKTCTDIKCLNNKPLDISTFLSEAETLYEDLYGSMGMTSSSEMSFRINSFEYMSDAEKSVSNNFILFVEFLHQ